MLIQYVAHRATPPPHVDALEVGSISLVSNTASVLSTDALHACRNLDDNPGLCNLASGSALAIAGKPPAKVCEPPLTVQILVQVAHFTSSSSSGWKLRSAVSSQCMEHIH